MEQSKVDQLAGTLPPSSVNTPQPKPPANDGGGKAVRPTKGINNFEPTIDPKELQVALAEKIQEINMQLKDGGRGLSFSIDEQLGRPIVTVKKASSGEVIRQIPGEVVLRIGHHIEKLKGLLFDGRS